MAGVKALRKIQLGLETSGSAGVAVAATTIWRGIGTIQDESEVAQRDEDVGYLSGLSSNYIPVVGATLEMNESEASFEQLPYLLLAGIDGSVTPTADGSGYVRTFHAATTTAKTPATYTIEGGDNQQAERFSYGFVEEFTIAGAPKRAVRQSAKWRGRQVATTTYTGSLSIPTVETILFNKGGLFIDAVGDAIGTLKSNTLLGFSLKWATGFTPVYTANGYTYFDFVKQVKPEVTLEITFEHNASSVTEIAAWRAGTPRHLRVSLYGSALQTPGATYSTKIVQINLAGYWETFQKLDEQDGNDIVIGRFKAAYNATANKFASMTVVNELSALP